MPEIELKLYHETGVNTTLRLSVVWAFGRAKVCLRFELTPSRLVSAIATSEGISLSGSHGIVWEIQ